MKRWAGLLLGLVLALTFACTARAAGDKDFGVLPLDGSVMKLADLQYGNVVRFHLDAPSSFGVTETSGGIGFNLILTRDGTGEVLRTSTPSQWSAADSTVITTKLGALLEPGDYALRIAPGQTLYDWTRLKSLELRAKTGAAKYTDSEPNDTAEHALDLSLPGACSGMVGAGDVDCVRFALDRQSTVLLNIKAEHGVNPMSGADIDWKPLMELLDSSGMVLDTRSVGTSGIDINKYLPAGDYIVRMGQGEPSLAGFPNGGHYYTLGVSFGDAVSAAKLPKKFTLTRGCSDKLGIVLTPSYASPTELIWSSSKPGIASVDEMGEVTGIKNGTTTIIARSPDGTIKTSCKLTVKSNVYNKSRPKRPAKKGLYIITKRLRYTDEHTIAIEAFVYNRLGGRLPYRALDGITASLYSAHSNVPVASTYVDSWHKSGSIANNSYGVIKYQVVTDRYDPLFDLRSGAFYAMLEGEPNYD